MKNIKQLFPFILTIFLTPLHSFSQTSISADVYDTYIKDTLLLEPSEVGKIPTLDPEIQKTLTFKAKTNGYKTYYYISGNKSSEGNILNKKPDGAWSYWIENGQLTKSVTFKEGMKDGPYKSWYENGNKNAEGKYVNDQRDGDWIFYNEDGSLMGNYKYHDGQLLNGDKN